MAYHSNENDHADIARRRDERRAAGREAERTRTVRQTREHHWATTLKNSRFLDTLLVLSKDSGVGVRQFSGDRPGDPPYWRFKHKATSLVLIPVAVGINVIITRGNVVSPPEPIDIEQPVEHLFSRCFDSARRE